MIRNKSFLKKIRIIAFAAIILFIFVSVFPGASSADTASRGKPIDIAVTFNRDSLTERNFAWITEDALKSQAVVVVKEVGGKDQKVFTGTTEIVAGRHEYSTDKTIFNSANNMFQFKISKVSATNLKPNTKYEYYCGDGTADNWSEKRYFDTGVSTGAFTFLYMTDSQCVSDTQFERWKKCSERAVTNFSGAKFAVIAGDLTDRGSSENLWNNFFKYGNKLLSNVTVVPAAGNHETDMGPHHFSGHFNFPKNKAGLPDYVYSFDFGNARFLVLSTEKTYAELTSKDENIKRQANFFVDAQIEWLRGEVLSNPKKWNIVILHKGIYSGGKYVQSDETFFYRNKLAPVFDELSIDAVLQGHNHTFDRAFLYEGKTVFPVTPETTSVTKTKGTLYLTANTAGIKFYKESSTKPAFLLKHAQPLTQLYTGITVTEVSMKFDTYAVTERLEDALYDTFTIIK